MSHPFTPDEYGAGCAECPMPEAHPSHTKPEPVAPPAPLASVPNMGVRLTPDQAETSQAAALVAWPRAGSKRAAVLEAVAAAGEYGATDDELAFDLDVSPNTVRPRRGELVSGGWVTARIDNGRECTRDSDQGNPATVWVLTPAAQERLYDAA